MAKYRSLVGEIVPEVDAIQYTGDNQSEVITFAKSYGVNARIDVDAPNRLIFDTDQKRFAVAGDFVAAVPHCGLTVIAKGLFNNLYERAVGVEMKTPRPKAVFNPDDALNAIGKVCEAYLDCIERGGSVDERYAFDGEIVETVLRALYGEKVFDFIDERIE